MAASAADRLHSELQSNWLSLSNILDSVSQASASLRGVPRVADTLRGTCEQFESETRILLAEPVESFLQDVPIRRSLEAIQRYDQEAPWNARSRAGIDSRFQAVLARTAISLCEPWNIRRRGDREDEWLAWNAGSDAHVKEATALLERYSAWARKTHETGQDKAQDKGKDKRYALWWRQYRAVAAYLQLEVSLRDLEVTWFSAAEHFAASVCGEREVILSQVRRALNQIDEATNDVPALVSAEERLRNWTAAVEESSARLPETAEVVRPARQPRWRTVAPRKAFRRTFAMYSQPAMGQIVESYWAQSAGMVRETARAREIVDYWRAASPANAKEQTLFTDATHNAAVILREQTEISTAAANLEAELIALSERWGEEGSTAIEAIIFGWPAILKQQRGRSLLRKAAVDGTRQGTRRAARNAGRWASDRIDRALESLGGRVPSRPTLLPVVRRTTLRDILSLPASRLGDLPALYRQLFRVAPVEDKRFLIGRSEELAGLEQAVRDWEAGRFAACLVVGARGSGKTSLLNCAAKDAFGNHVLIRGQFDTRALSREKIDAFLRRLIGLPEDADLEKAFGEQRRIIVVEEAERIYLRKVGGFNGTQYLVQLIHHTAPTTLWIIGMNDKALRVLDANSQFRRVFSHRINAASVSRENLEKAILERHRLSGLRLEFAPPPAEDPRVSRIKRFTGLEDSAQKLFFDSLFQQSEGILRSAFELWVRSIDGVEGETLRIRQPLDPAFGAFRSELAQEDHFTLLAIQEHGSLTQNELSETLCESIDASRSRLDRLAALGLVETDPEHPGLRIRPEAQRFTNDVLRRANLT